MQGLKQNTRKQNIELVRKGSAQLETRLPGLASSYKIFPTELKLEIGLLNSQRLRENPEIARVKTKTCTIASRVFSDSNTIQKSLGSFVIEGVSSTHHMRPSSKPRIFELTRSKTSLPSKQKVEISDKELREWLYCEWISLIQRSIGVTPAPPSSTYKYFVGPGNNSHLINQIIKTRWWWRRVKAPVKANFVWTQVKHRPTLERINSYRLVKAKSSPLIYCKRPKAPQSLLLSKTQASGFDLVQQSEHYSSSFDRVPVESSGIIMHNHLPNNASLCTKKMLFKNMKRYYEDKGVDPFKRIPFTIHVDSEEGMQEFQKYHEPDSLWIVKPAENTNRGYGIKVTSDLSEIQNIVQSSPDYRSYIIQKYIKNPLLINRRKFDIRCYGLVSYTGKRVQGYFFKEGYIRTSSREFSLRKLNDKFIHLTNDAVQKRSSDYGKFELANKMSFSEFSKYLRSLRSDLDFYCDILPRIERRVTDSIEAISDLLDASENTFEVLGYDFLMDDCSNIWLLEVNSNPCLELSSSYLASLIPSMLENVFNIVLDPLFPPPQDHKKYKHWVQETSVKNQFSLVYAK